MVSERKFVADIVRRVLTSQVSVREAILQFPRDTEDKSIHAAYHALVHLEADEDLRARDIVYREEQDDYLEMIAQTLFEEEDLPENIIKNYEQYYTSANLLHEKNTKGFLKGFLKYLNIGEK